MKLLIMVLCLLSERFLMHALSYKRFNWLENYSRKITQGIGKYQFKSPWLLLAALVLPLVLAFAIVYLLVGNIFFGVLGLLLNIVIFYYCLGPDNPFYPVSDGENGVYQVGNYFALVNSELFSVIFWYSIAGPIALLFYRLVSLLTKNIAVTAEATVLTDLLEWVPARITVLLYLLVGNFQRAMPVFSKFLLSKPNVNNQMLSECGLLAVQPDDSMEISIVKAENLVELSCVVLLVLIALFTIIAWL